MIIVDDDNDDDDVDYEEKTGIKEKDDDYHIKSISLPFLVMRISIHEANMFVYVLYILVTDVT